MAQEFVFVGNPGKQAADMLKIIKTAGLVPKRINPSAELIGELSEGSPVAVMLAVDVENVEEIVSRIRSERFLADVPIIAGVNGLDEEYLKGLFTVGIDDYHVVGSENQFISLVAAIGKADSWGGVRAPAGQVIFADPERMERIRFGRILKRNGFDTYFAGNIEELAEATSRIDARVVIASTRLEGGSLLDVVASTSKEKDEPPPWVIISGQDEAEQMGRELKEKPQIVFFEKGADAEGITFFMNELLALPPVGARKSQRILYSVPVSFVPKGGNVPFWGFTFNVNMGGLYIRSLTSFPLQTPIDILFRPPYGRGQVFVSAQVVWQKKYGDSAGPASPPGMGIQFLDMWQADQAAFDEGYRLLFQDSQDKPTNSIGPKFPTNPER